MIDDIMEQETKLYQLWFFNKNTNRYECIKWPIMDYKMMVRVRAAQQRCFPNISCISLPL